MNTHQSTLLPHENKFHAGSGADGKHYNLQGVKMNVEPKRWQYHNNRNIETETSYARAWRAKIRRDRVNKRWQAAIAVIIAMLIGYSIAVWMI